jgi:hypothetical protein
VLAWSHMCAFGAIVADMAFVTLKSKSVTSAP